jgi:DNA-binding HxlR family transcriptional regulator
MLRVRREKSAAPVSGGIVTEVLPESEDACPPDGACGTALSCTPADDPTVSDDFERAYRLLQRLANRWTFPILGRLQHQPMRFAKLKRSLQPVSQRMLTLSLRHLERDGLVYRQEVPGQPPQVTYGLTPLGLALFRRLKDFEAWLQAHDKLNIPPPQN